MKIRLKKKPAPHARGTVVSIVHGSRYGDAEPDPNDRAEVTVRHRRQRVKNKKGYPIDDDRRSTLQVPGHMARQLKVGQRVRVHLDPD